MARLGETPRMQGQHADSRRRIMNGFNLAVDPCIPVLAEQGTTEVSLTTCLTAAHRFAGLTLDTPLEAVALLRQVLLPAYIDAVFQEPGCPPPADADQWAELWSAESLDRWPSWYPGSSTAEPPITSYLKRHHDLFEVFGDAPFAQVSDLQTPNGTTKPVSLLLPSIATGNNVPLFSARTEADPPALPPAAAIRAVLSAHCWDTAGIKSGAAGDPQVKAGKTTGNQTGPLGAIGNVIPLGRTLKDTILLHLRCSSDGDPVDRPQWRRADKDEAGPEWKARAPLGLLDLLTWQGRRIRLIPEQSDDGVRVRQVVLCAGDRLDGGTPQVEPHCAWRMSKQTKRQVPVRHTAGQAAWRGMLPMLAASGRATTHGSSSRALVHVREMQYGGALPADYPLRVLCVGLVYGTQKAVVEDVVTDLLPIPIAALDDSGEAYQLVEEIVQQSEELRQAVNRLSDDLRVAAGGDRVPWDRGQRAGDQMMQDFDRSARDALSGLQNNPTEAETIRNDWIRAARGVVWKTAETLLSGAAPQSFLGRTVKNQHPQRAATAERWFRIAVTKILGRPADVHSSGEATR